MRHLAGLGNPSALASRSDIKAASSSSSSVAATLFLRRYVLQLQSTRSSGIPFAKCLRFRPARRAFELNFSIRRRARQLEHILILCTSPGIVAGSLVVGGCAIRAGGSAASHEKCEAFPRRTKQNALLVADRGRFKARTARVTRT